MAQQVTWSFKTFSLYQSPGFPVKIMHVGGLAMLKLPLGLNQCVSVYVHSVL